MDNFELAIENNEKIYYPNVEEGVQWETARKGSPGKITFTIVKDAIIDFQEGNRVRLIVDGKNVFLGFIFTKKRNKENTINVTAYDQVRYLKNKDTYVYSNMTASDFIRRVASDFQLNVGELEDTGYIIAERIEDNTTIFDMVQNALDLTLQNTKKMYVLYDDFGQLILKDIESMKLDILIDNETGENFDYTTSIDGNTYNQVKLSRDNEETGKRDIYIVKDTGNINKWGVLQYFEVINENTNGRAKADALSQLYNKKTRNLKITNVFGDTRVRAGTSVIVQLHLGDIEVQNYMIVEKAIHKFRNNEYLMDLTLRGGDFIG